MQKHFRTRTFGGRLLSASSLVCFALLAAVGCGDDEKGTDIVVPAPSDGGEGGTHNTSGGTNSHAGTSSPTDGGTGEGGASDGGMSSGTAGSAGSAGKSNGGNGGMSGSSGSSAGSGGSAGSSAGNGGTAGSSAGNGGSAGTPATGGTGGGGSGSSGAGAGGMSGSAGLGGMAGSAGAGGTTAGGGNGGDAGTAGTGGSTSTCGDSKTEGTEECDDGGPSRLCTDDCRVACTPACLACEQAGDCQFSSDNCLGPEGNPFTPSQVAACYDVLRCIQDSNCLDGAGSIGKCYCGTLVGQACDAAPFDLKMAGAPNGPCAAVMQLGAPTITSNAQMRAGVTTKTRPTGAAGQRLNCQKTDPECKSICGVE